MEPGMILHLLRNPWGHSDDEVRQARLAAADELERWRRTVDHPGSAVQWIAEMQPQLYALRARVAELEAALSLAVDAMRAPLDGWKGEVERQALDVARATLRAGVGLSGNKTGSRE